MCVCVVCDEMKLCQHEVVLFHCYCFGVLGKYEKFCFDWDKFGKYVDDANLHGGLHGAMLVFDMQDCWWNFCYKYGTIYFDSWLMIRLKSVWFELKVFVFFSLTHSEVLLQLIFLVMG
jgi:hypothetical protein